MPIGSFILNRYATWDDPADQAMYARVRDRFAAERKGRRRQRTRHAELPNLIIIGGLKCGTTSIHHYLGLHPHIQMSKPKELHFFVEELNWNLGLGWYANHFDNRFEVRGESSSSYTHLPRFQGVAERIKQHCPDARLIYMVRDPIKRLLAHWVYMKSMGYEAGDLVEVLSRPETSYVNRSRYWMQLQPYLERFDPSQILILTQEELSMEREATMRKAFAFAGVDPSFTSPLFDREWEKSNEREADRYRLVERLIKLPGFRSFDRMPESMRWIAEKLVHDPEKSPAPKPKLPDDLFETIRGRFTEDVAELQQFAGRRFAGWHDYGNSEPAAPSLAQVQREIMQMGTAAPPRPLDRLEQIEEGSFDIGSLPGDVPTPLRILR